MYIHVLQVFAFYVESVAQVVDVISTYLQNWYIEGGHAGLAEEHSSSRGKSKSTVLFGTWMYRC